MMYKYKVYQVDELNYGDGNPSHTNKQLLGTTFAVSEKKAISNIKFRCNIKPSDLFCEYRGDGYRRSELVAELA